MLLKNYLSGYLRWFWLSVVLFQTVNNQCPGTMAAATAMGPTPAQIKLITTSWTRIKQNRTDFVVRFTDRYFEMFPEDKKFFTFTSIPKYKWKDTYGYNVYVVTFFANINFFVEGINEKDKCSAVVEEYLTIFKSQIEGAIQVVLHMESVFLEMFKTYLSKEEMAAFKKLLRCVYNILKERF